MSSVFCDYVQFSRPLENGKLIFSEIDESLSFHLAELFGEGRTLDIEIIRKLLTIKGNLE